MKYTHNYRIGHFIIDKEEKKIKQIKKLNVIEPFEYKYVIFIGEKKTYATKKKKKKIGGKQLLEKHLSNH